jgi:hypothetical protein
MAVAGQDMLFEKLGIQGIPIFSGNSSLWNQSELDVRNATGSRTANPIGNAAAGMNGILFRPAAAVRPVIGCGRIRNVLTH